jgi:hypothetical protein
MFGIVLEHFANLRHIKRGKTCVSSLNALFQGTELVKHPFYSIGPKNDVWECFKDFANLRHIKRGKISVSSLTALFQGTEVLKHPFYTIGPKNDVWECFGAFC